MAEPEVEAVAVAAAAMETEAPAAAGQKREREETGDGSAEGGEETAAAAEETAAAKKQKVERESKGGKEGEEGKSVKLGPKEFSSSVEMFDYFFALLHSWSPQLDFNKYEHMVLEDMLKKGHTEPTKKIGQGIDAFEVRNHPVWRSHCFFVRRVDGSADDFSFRKCVDNILPLPEDMKIGNRKSGGHGHHKNGGGRGGQGVGGHGRHGPGQERRLGT